MKKINAARALFGAWAVLAVLLALAVGAAAEGTAGVDVRSGASINVQNGSFEKGQTWADGYYKQPDQAAVPSWNTSAFEGKIELFRENLGIYIPGVTLKPADEKYAAELNADEESTLYQVLNTQPSSIYEWSLSHGARTTADTMALIIGPNQSVPDSTASQGFRCLLSKPNKNGRDQFMQMIDWLDKQGELNGTYTNGLYNGGKPITLYSKRFAENGAFKDNAGNNPFSLTPSPFYTQKWQIWLMQDHRATSGTGTNPWRTYGTSAANNGGNANSSLAEAYYRYTVPTGQRQTLFGFVSVSTEENKGKTFGNFLDGITFTIYHPLTASTTPHGSAIIISTLDNKQVGQYEVKPDQDVNTYVQRGVALNLEVKFPEAGVTFAGVYYKTSDGEKVFIPNRDSGSGNPWKKDDTNGRFTYTTAPVETGVELYFVFIKSPMITYDPNGGDAYNCGQTGTGEDPNVYSFKPNGTQRVSPYTAHAATKTTNGIPDEGWRFTGWQLSDDNNTKTENGKPLILPGEHTVACNYDFDASGNQQPFVIINGENTFVEQKDAAGNVTSWRAPSGVTPLYDQNAMGLTLVAQWQWKQTFVPCVKQANGQYTASQSGGTVTINKANTEAAEIYGISYFAEEQETITVTATANTGYTFEGWYDGNGELKAIEPELTYEVGKGDVRKYYARFVGNVVQNYIRQIPNASEEWIEVTNENVAALDHTQYAVGPGTVVDSTPGADTEDYVFEGWYDSSFHRVADTYILNGRTLNYPVTGNATYYARFVPRIRFEVRYVDANGNVTTPPVPGETYGTVSQTEAAELPGTSISSTASPATGYRFVGWYDSDGSNKTHLGSDATYTGAMPPVGTTYYAMFTAGNNSRYKVQHIKVKPDGSTEVASEATTSSVPTGTAVSAQSITIPGYTYQENRFTVNGTPYQSNPTGKVRGDGQLVLKLYYTPQNTSYRIEYYKLDAQGNETLAGTENKTAETDEVVSVTGYENKYQSEGYSFAAHYGKNLLTGTVTVDPVLVLKVYYKPLEHTVRFDMHGFGAQVPPQTVPHNGMATQPEDPVELGYVFGGWYTDDTYATRYNFSTAVTQDIVIHAKWNMIWPVDFDMQGHGEPVDRQLVEDGNKATRPAPDPTAEGYVFKGWYTEAACQNEFNFTNTPIKKVTTVYAKWTANVAVTKVWEGGSAAEVQVWLLKDGQSYDSMPESDPDSTGVSTPQTCEQILNTTNSWTHTWTNLPADSNYTVEEIVVPGDCTAVYEKLSTNSWKITNVRDKQMAVTVTNTHRSDTIGMVIRKEWDDAGNRNRPGSVRVRIVNAKTNAVVQEHELNAGNNWTWNVAGLPKRQDGGETVRYLVQEVGEYAGYSAACEIVVEADGSYTVKLTNVLTGKLDIGGEKLWEDGGDRDGLRPDSVQLKIYQNAIAEQNLVRIVQVTAAPNSGVDDPWTWSVQDLPVYDGFGRPITYIVVEDPVPAGYDDPGPRRIPVTP